MIAPNLSLTTIHRHDFCNLFRHIARGLYATQGSSVQATVRCDGFARLLSVGGGALPAEGAKGKRYLLLRADTPTLEFYVEHHPEAAVIDPFCFASSPSRMTTSSRRNPSSNPVAAPDGAAAAAGGGGGGG